MQRRCRQLFAISVGEPISGIERIRLKHHDALMPGRFDQQVTVNSPHIAGREIFFLDLVFLPVSTGITGYHEISEIPLFTERSFQTNFEFNFFYSKTNTFSIKT
jgi:hypothetical protein